jgi:hypothetical protein
MSLDELQSEILTSAILGTERHPLSLPKVEGALSHVLDKLDTTDKQHHLLSVNALVGIYTRAGKLPAHAQKIQDTPCQPDTNEYCSPTAALLLSSMLSGSNKEIIPEWLSLAIAHKKRIPDELLPEILQYIEKNPDLIEKTLQVIGNRGRWLVLRMPGMEKFRSAIRVESLPEDEIENFWQTEKLYARNLLLQKIRKINPANGLALVSSTWKEDKADERNTFLSTLIHGISMDDEPFLENALDDRSREVRQTAIDLLSYLPQSRLVQRQITRIQPYIQWQPGSLLRKAQLEFSFPEEITKEMERDGVIRVNRFIRTFGEKGNILLHILRSIPPTYWNTRLQKNPQELLEIIQASDLKDLILESWNAATSLSQDSEWAKTLQPFFITKTNFLNYISKSELEPYLLQQFKINYKVALQLLRFYGEPWTEELTKTALYHLQELAPKGLAQSTSFMLPIYSLNYMARHMEPYSAIELFTKYAKKADPASEWGRRIETSLQLLDFRKRMMEEFN